MSHILKSLKSAQKERDEKDAKDKGFRISSILNPLDIGKKKFHLSKNTYLLIVVVSLFSFSIFYTVYSFYFKRKPIGTNIVALGKTGVPKNELQKPASPDTSTRETPSSPPEIDEKQLIAQKASAKLDEVRIKTEPENKQSDVMVDTRKVDQKEESKSNLDTIGMVSANAGSEPIKTPSGSELQKPASPDTSTLETPSPPPEIDEKQLIAQKATAKLDEVRIKAKPENEQSDLKAGTRKVDQKEESKSNLDTIGMVSANAGSELIKTPSGSELQKLASPDTSTRETSSLPPKTEEKQLITHEASTKLDEVINKAEKEQLVGVRKSSDLSVYHFNSGLLYQKQKKMEKAKKEYEKVISLDPLNAEVHNNLGMVYKDLGELDKSIAEYKKALALDPNYKNAHYNQAVALYLKGELNTAAEECRLAIALDAKDSACYNILGLTYKKMGRNSFAMDVFKKALSINPTNSQTHYNLALLLEQEGETEEAVFHYQEFIALSNPENNRNLIDRVKKHLEQIHVH